MISASALPSDSAVRTTTRSTWVWRFAALCWAAIIALGCLQEAGGGSPGWWRLPHMDKLAHAGMHGLLAWLLWQGRSAAQDAIRTGLRIVLLCAAYGLFIEWGQAQFTLTRSAEALDAVANTAGAMLGVLVAMRLPRILKFPSRIRPT